MSFTVYLIHQHEKLGQPDSDAHRAALGRAPRKPGARYQSGHYIGKTKDLARRIKEHQDNRGAYYMGAVNRAGITWCVARTWKFETWAEAGAWERKLKNRKAAPRLCPYCNPQGWKNQAMIKEREK